MSCLEKGSSDSAPPKKKTCSLGMESTLTCVEALFVDVSGVGVTSTYQGCASLGGGFESEVGLPFILYPDDVKLNGCMTKEQIQRYLNMKTWIAGKPPFKDPTNSLKICFCNCGDCCNANIFFPRNESCPKSTSSVDMCPKEDNGCTGFSCLGDKAWEVIDDGVEKLTGSSVTIHAISKIYSFFTFTIILCSFQVVMIHE